LALNGRFDFLFGWKRYVGQSGVGHGGLRTEAFCEAKS